MISPELLRRYPFFGFLESAQLKAVAMIAEELTARTDEIIFENDEPAQHLYLLMEGGADIIYRVNNPEQPGLDVEFYVGELNPGEVFGISALIEPHLYTSTVRVTGAARLLRIPAAPLRALCEVDPKLAYGLMRQIAQTAMERLHSTRVQLAVARA